MTSSAKPAAERSGGAPPLDRRVVGLSTLTIFLGLVFWSWVFGAVGTVLSVPLTIVVKLMLEKPAAAPDPAPV